MAKNLTDEVKNICGNSRSSTYFQLSIKFSCFIRLSSFKKYVLLQIKNDVYFNTNNPVLPELILFDIKHEL